MKLLNISRMLDSAILYTYNIRIHLNIRMMGFGLFLKDYIFVIRQGKSVAGRGYVQGREEIPVVF